jgi:hypothetical protein
MKRPPMFVDQQNYYCENVDTSKRSIVSLQSSSKLQWYTSQKKKTQNP